MVEPGRFDLVVVGLGAVGSAALYHASKAGLRVLGIDRFDPPHAMGSSHADSRITRLAVGEGEQYLPFVARSHEIWRDLEAATGENLLYQPGGYIITPPARTEDQRWGGFVDRTAAVAATADIDFEIRSPTAVQAHLPMVKLHGDERIGFEATGGVVACERAIAVQLQQARAAGAITEVNRAVTSVVIESENIVVHAGERRYEADRAVVATGAWFSDLARPAAAAAVRVTRQVVYWFDVDEPEAFSAKTFPFIIWPGHTIAEYSAVFPGVTDGLDGRRGLKLVGEQFDVETSAETVDRAVSATEAQSFYERLVEPRLSGVNPTLLDAVVCLYTNTADDHFLIDSDPSGRVLYASPCSGHGFKHSTAIGEALVRRLMGKGHLDLSAFLASQGAKRTLKRRPQNFSPKSFS